MLVSIVILDSKVQKLIAYDLIRHQIDTNFDTDFIPISIQNRHRNVGI